MQLAIDIDFNVIVNVNNVIVEINANVDVHSTSTCLHCHEKSNDVKTFSSGCNKLLEIR
jgi:hypothetical protein